MKRKIATFLTAIAISAFPMTAYAAAANNTACNVENCRQSGEHTHSANGTQHHNGTGHRQHNNGGHR